MIEALREAIEDIDYQICALLARRRNVSLAIQVERVQTGGPRTSLQQEMRVIERYYNALGPDGSAVAHAVLGISRGAA